MKTSTLTNPTTLRAALLPLLLLTGCDDAPEAAADEVEEAALEGDLDPKLAVTLLGHSPEIGDPGRIIDGDPGLDLWSSKPGPHDGWHYVDLDLGGKQNVTAIRLLEDDMVEWSGWGIDQWEFEIFDGGTQKYWSGTMDSHTNAWQTVDHPDHQGDRVRLWLNSWNHLVSVREVEVRGTGLGGQPPVDPPVDPPVEPPVEPPTGDGGMPDAPGGWVLDMQDDFDTLEWHKWKQQQNGIPLYHTVMWWKSATHCVPVDGYLEMRARKRNDGSGEWDGCYIDQGTWWDEQNNRPAHPGYDDYQVSFKAELPEGIGTGIYALMWPVAESWGGSPWPPEFDIVELPNNDGSDIMVTWHYNDPEHVYESTHPKFDRTGGKEWVYTVRREHGHTRMWIGDPDTGEVTEVAVPASVNTHPTLEKRLLFGMSNFVSSTWALSGNTEHGSASWYGDANATGSTAWTGRIDWVKIYKPGPGMSGQ